MKNLIWVLMFFVIASCAPTSILVDNFNVVSVASVPNLEVESRILNSQSRNQINDQKIIEQKGTYYLDKVVLGYSNQLDGIYFDNADQSGLHFEVESMQVKKGFTFNLIDPGPVYKMTMKVNIYQNGHRLNNETYITKVNMAQIVNEDKFWNWLSSEEISDTDNQILTFERGLRNLYRDVYFKHLNISLTL
ncbi:MAG: hypothetical protein JJ895_01710 [Balneolaceae bacterium]|nr:hypothetical protein [Balneolaceae bacterium]